MILELRQGIQPDGCIGWCHKILAFYKLAALVEHLGRLVRDFPPLVIEFAAAFQKFFAGLRQRFPPFAGFLADRMPCLGSRSWRVQ